MEIFFELPNEEVKDKEVIDFRSDTVTKPTDIMFEVMKQATKGDDVYDEDKSIHELQDRVAKLSGHEEGLFVASATMSNQLAIRTWMNQPPHSILCDSRSHIFNYEAGGAGLFSQASAQPIMPKNGRYLTVEDLEENIIQTEDVHRAPTKLICLENTLDGMIFPLEEIRRIRKLCLHRGIKLHLDGARLWNACIATGISLKEYCINFDSVSLCLSKGLGAPIGAVLVSNKDSIKKARHFRKAFGGGWRQAGMLAAAADFAITHNWPKLNLDHQRAKAFTAGLRAIKAFKIVKPVETNMVFFRLDLDDKSLNSKITHQLVEYLGHKGIIIGSPYPKNLDLRLVFHHQQPKNTISKTLYMIISFLVSKGILKAHI